MVSTLLGLALPSIVTSVRLSLCRFRDICDSSAVKLLRVARISFIRSSRILSLREGLSLKKKLNFKKKNQEFYLIGNNYTFESKAKAVNLNIFFLNFPPH